MERITLHQLRRRDLWIDVVKNDDIGTADKVLAAFDAKFSEPGSSNLEIEVTVEGEILKPTAELHPKTVEIIARGAAGSGKTTLLELIHYALATCPRSPGTEPVRVVSAGDGQTEEELRRSTGCEGRLLILRDA